MKCWTWYSRFSFRLMCMCCCCPFHRGINHPLVSFQRSPPPTETSVVFHKTFGAFPEDTLFRRLADPDLVSPAGLGSHQVFELGGVDVFGQQGEIGGECHDCPEGGAGR